MTVQYSTQKMVSDGTLSTIVLGIQYLQRNDIYMRIAGEETPPSGAPSGYTWSFINNTTLKILPVVPSGVEVVVYRRTDVDAMYNIYSQNAQFDESTIDENNQQLLYIAQEYLEQGIPGAGVESLEYINTVAGISYYRFRLTDGAVTPPFGVPDGTYALRTELSSTGGVSLIGSASYAQIRAYSGGGTKINCVGRSNIFDGGYGTFILDTADTTSPDNDGTVLVDVLGRRWKRQYSGVVNVLWFGADPTAITDSIAAFNAARDSVSSLGGDLYAPKGMYKLSSKFELTSGVSLYGDGCFKGTDADREGVTILFCEHTGPAMLSLKGANGCYVRNLSLQGSSTVKPKTGLMLGRSSAASAGHHHIENVTVIGYFTVAGIYNIASEENSFTNVWSWNFGGDARYGLVVSTQDIFNVDGMTSSTCLFNNFYNLRLYNTSPSASAAGIFLQCAQEMGSINFFGVYIIQYAGAYIRISQGAIDGVRALGPFNFHGVAGEIYSGGNPKCGFDLVSSVPLNWQGLNIDNPRLQLPANSNGDICDIRQDINTTLYNPKIIMSPPEAFPYASSLVRREKIIGGVVSVGRVGDWVALSLNPGWSSPYGSPYAQPAYRVSSDGTVELRGIVQSSSGGDITSLPFSHSGGDLLFVTFGTSSIARLKLSKTTGALSLFAGAATSGIDLTPIRFSIH